MLTNFIPLEELQARREGFVESMVNNSSLILPANPVTYKNGDWENAYRQDSNFWYFTGHDFPEAMYVIKKSAKGKVKEKLFVRLPDSKKELWTGKMLTKEEIRKITGIKNIGNIDDFNVADYDNDKFYFDTDSLANKSLIKSWTEDMEPEYLENANDIIKFIRVKKSPWEIEQIKKAVAISKQAHIKAEKYIAENPECFEYQIQAVLEYEMANSGTKIAYESIVASGNNATTLHYVKNNSKIKKGDFILIDAACEYNYYSADITRTYISGGDMSEPQNEIFTLVQKAYEKGVEMSAKVDVRLSDLQREVTVVLVKGMIKLGILKETLEDELILEDYVAFWPHGFGHWLGLDTHDNGDYLGKGDSGVTLKPGNVLTIEPGLYFEKDNDKVPEKYKGIGVRIEDDVLITQEGSQVL